MRSKFLITASAVLVISATGCSGSDSSSAATTAPSSTTSATASTAPAVATTPVTTPATTGPTSTVAATTPSTASPSVPATAPVGAVDPNAPEAVEPGDIPDDQVFVTFPSPDGVFSVDVPEGWAQTEQNGAVTFTDNYNSVTIESKPAASAPTVDSVTTDGLADVSTDPSFTLVDTTTVKRKGGDAVLATYEIGSAPNSVTGKKALLAVERYVFFNNGTELILTLSGAKGADNVDPWRIVSDSVTWL